MGGGIDALGGAGAGGVAADVRQGPVSTDTERDRSEAAGVPTAVDLLVVDSERILAEALQVVLGGVEGITVVGVAHSASDGMRLTAALLPDVVLVAHLLPDGDGLSMARAIRSGHSEVSVILMGDHEAHAMLLLSAAAAGCAGCVSKAQTLGELVSAVRAASSGRAVFPTVRSLAAAEHDAKAYGMDASHTPLRQDHSLADQLPRPLSPRELDVLALMAEGLPNKVVAHRLGISLHTVRNHVQRILEKLGAHSKLEAIAKCARDGLVIYDTGTALGSSGDTEQRMA